MPHLNSFVVATLAVPSEQDKALALKLAYEMNCRSMFHWGSYDMAEILTGADTMQGWVTRNSIPSPWQPAVLGIAMDEQLIAHPEELLLRETM